VQQNSWRSCRLLVDSCRVCGLGRLDLGFIGCGKCCQLYSLLCMHLMLTSMGHFMEMV